MSFLNSLEQKGLFVLTRGLALLVILGLVVGIATLLWSATLGGEPLPDGRVNTQELVAVMRAVKKGEPIPETAAARRRDLRGDGVGAPTIPGNPDPLAGLKLPANERFREWMKNATLKGIFEGWVKEVPRQNRQAFLDGIGAVISEAEKVEKDGVVVSEALTAYVESARNAREEAKAAREVRKAERERALYAAVAGLALVALFSLVLVLLAIERNTRRTVA